MANRLHGRDLALFRGDRCLFKGLEFAADTGQPLSQLEALDNTKLTGSDPGVRTTQRRIERGIVEYPPEYVGHRNLEGGPDDAESKIALAGFRGKSGPQRRTVR